MYNVDSCTGLPGVCLLVVCIIGCMCCMRVHTLCMEIGWLLQLPIQHSLKRMWHRFINALFQIKLLTSDCNCSLNFSSVCHRRPWWSLWPWHSYRWDHLTCTTCGQAGLQFAAHLFLGLCCAIFLYCYHYALWWEFAFLSRSVQNRFELVWHFFEFQEYRSEKSLEALKKLVPPRCHWYVNMCLYPKCSHILLACKITRLVCNDINSVVFGITHGRRVCLI